MFVYISNYDSIDVIWSKEELPEYEEKVASGDYDKIVLDIDDNYDVEKYQYSIIKDEDGNYKLRIKDKETKEILFEDILDNFDPTTFFSNLTSTVTSTITSLF